MPGTRKLGRTSDQRKAMLRAMVTYLLENGKIETTVTRAKEVAAMTEKMITLGKAGDLHSKRQVLSYVTKEDVAKKLFDNIAPSYEGRNGGYTKIINSLFYVLIFGHGIKICGRTLFAPTSVAMVCGYFRSSLPMRSMNFLPAMPFCEKPWDLSILFTAF